MLNNQQAIQRVQQTFLHPYNDNNYSIFISDLLKNIQTEDNFEIQIDNDNHIESYKRIGSFEDDNGDIIDILSVKVKNGAILERTRTKLRDFAVNHIKNSITVPDGCLVAFYAEEFSDWRFSFIKMDYRVIKDLKTGKTITDRKISEPKRYSFLIGSDEPSYTAQKQMIPLLQSQNIVFNDIVDAFSTERVTNEFYLAYRELFDDLCKSLNEIKNKDQKIRENFEKEFIKVEDFAKKLLGQIVFIYFIQRKGWLGIKRGKDGSFGKWGSGDKKFIRNLFNKQYCDYNNFFNDVLEHLFYNALGNENPDDYFSRLNCKIPFLNGGIFEPINGYNWIETDIKISNKIVEKILDVFDRYNFTIREESSLDQDVAIDPEMLGRVFENLLDENIKKGKGTYYTPRSIVKYMTIESILDYLRCETAGKIEFTIIKNFVTDGCIKNLTKFDAEIIDAILKDVKICDPAIGSGAFPMGILTHIVNLRSLLCFVKKVEISRYELKKYTIINSIYGVDLDPGAVEIAKLRLFLSLIVDEDDYDTIDTLPNLDFQIMQGNSLIEEFYGVTLDINKKTTQGNIFEKFNEIDELINRLYHTQSLFSIESNLRKKTELKNKIEEIVISIFKLKYKEKVDLSEVDSEKMNQDINDLIQRKKPKDFFPWKLYFADIFRSKGGFDIVIGNPPYIQLQKKLNSNSKYADLYKNLNFKTFDRTGDIYSLFYELGLKIANNNGNLCYITSNRWMRSNYGKTLRKFFLDYNPKKLIDFTDNQLFKSATVSVNIALINKSNNEGDLKGLSINQNYNMLDNIHELFDNNSIEMKNLGDNQWFLESKEESLIKNKIEINGTELDKWSNIKIFRGILTGYNKAFIVDKNIKKQIVKDEPSASNLLKPLLRGKDIKQYTYEDSELYLINTHNGYSDKNGQIVNRIHIDDYPVVKTFLENIEEKRLSGVFGEKEKKAKGLFKRDDQGDTPYNLRNCAYMSDFDNEKIVWKILGENLAFSIAGSGVFISASAAAIVSKNNIYLLGVLMSSLIKYYVYKYSDRTGMGDIALSVKSIKKIPVPLIENCSNDDISKIEILVHKIIDLRRNDQNCDINQYQFELDELIFNLYQINEEEKNYILKNI